MKYLVTGVLGFIGSRLAQNLLLSGKDVIGVDSCDNLLYSEQIKYRRLDSLSQNRNFEFVKLDLVKDEFDYLLKEVHVIINEAGLPGQLLSWEHTAEYFDANFFIVDRIIKAIAKADHQIRLVQASTSSVYGSNACGNEDQATNPCSPYGISKLAAENLIRASDRMNNFSFTILRYFSVYGPSQRPDMAFSKFFHNLAAGEPITIYGDGTQIRDCTFVDDIVSGTILAAEHPIQNMTYNLSSGISTSLLGIIDICFEVSGLKVPLIFEPRSKGDQERTSGNCSKALEYLGYQAKVGLGKGLKLQWDSFRTN